MSFREEPVLISTVVPRRAKATNLHALLRLISDNKSKSLMLFIDFY